MGGRFLHLSQRRLNKTTFNARHLRLHDLIREGADDEDGLPLEVADTFAVNADPLDRDDDRIADPKILSSRSGPLPRSICM